MTYTRPRRRTTCDPGIFLSALSELRTFTGFSFVDVLVVENDDHVD
jgi:hypothetical protein